MIVITCAAPTVLKEGEERRGEGREGEGGEGGVGGGEEEMNVFSISATGVLSLTLPSSIK